MTTPFNTNLKDQVAVVTVGGGVLGSYFCRALVDAGAKVAILSRTLESCETVASLDTQVSKTGSYEQWNRLPPKWGQPVFVSTSSLLVLHRAHPPSSICPLWRNPR